MVYNNFNPDYDYDRDFGEYDDVIKDCATYIQTEIKNRFNVSVKISHCHELVAAILQFNSKVALTTYNNGPIYDPFFIASPSENFTIGDVNNVQAAVLRFKESPCKNIDPYILYDIVYASLIPVCEHCEIKSSHSYFVYNDNQEPIAVVCHNCYNYYEDMYARCWCCGDDFLYRSDIINRFSECPIHDGESSYDEDEEQDILDYIEYNTKDN